MKHFWITFAGLPPYTPFALGCGVTGIERVDEDIASAIADPHVFPNMGVVTLRGIWFPPGMQEDQRT